MNPLIANRRSIRKFDPSAEISKTDLIEILKAAQFAPSACNSRPWEFIAVTGRANLNALADAHPFAQMCRTASAVIIVIVTPQQGIPEGFFPQDGAAATQNILLQALELGYGTCWCGVYPKEPHITFLRKMYDIAEPKIPFSFIAVGKPAEHPDARGHYEESKVRFVE